MHSKSSIHSRSSDSKKVVAIENVLIKAYS